MNSSNPARCQCAGENPNCAQTPDPECTQRFDEIGEKPVYFCRPCASVVFGLWNHIVEYIGDDPEKHAHFKSVLDELAPLDPKTFN